MSLVVAAVGKSKTTPDQRIQAAAALEQGEDVLIAGVRIHPER